MPLVLFWIHCWLTGNCSLEWKMWEIRLKYCFCPDKTNWMGINYEPVRHIFERSGTVGYSKEWLYEKVWIQYRVKLINAHNIHAGKFLAFGLIKQTVSNNLCRNLINCVSWFLDQFRFTRIWHDQAMLCNSYFIYFCNFVFKIHLTSKLNFPLRIPVNDVIGRWAIPKRQYYELFVRENWL